MDNFVLKLLFLKKKKGLSKGMVNSSGIYNESYWRAFENRAHFLLHLQCNL